MLQKGRWAVEAYEQLVGRLAPQRVLELGVLEGGSVALLALLARPEKLVAVDNLALFIDQHHPITIAVERDANVTGEICHVAQHGVAER